jgi:FtsH-binding integral membrane protein
MLMYGAAGAAAGLMLLGVFADGNRGQRDVTAYTSIEKSRIHATYSYLLGGVVSTGAIATAMFRAGFAARMLSMNPWVMLGGSLVLTIGTMIGTQAISYHNTLPKHAMWLAFNTCIAASLAPLGFLGGPLVMKAAVITGCVVGGLSIAGAAAPSDTWLQMRGPLSIGLGVVIGASFGQIFFPTSSILYNVALYGGLAVFGGFVLFDTARIRRAAQYAPDYDPINASLGVYMNSVNIFVRIVQLLSGGGNRRK